MRTLDPRRSSRIRPLNSFFLFYTGVEGFPLGNVDLGFLPGNDQPFAKPFRFGGTRRDFESRSYPTLSTLRDLRELNSHEGGQQGSRRIARKLTCFTHQDLRRGSDLYKFWTRSVEGSLRCSFASFT